MADRRYTIRFSSSSDDDQQRFKYLYGWFVAGGNLADRKGVEGARREAKLVDKFWDVSQRPGGMPADVEGLRQLKVGDWGIELDQQELDLIKRYVESISPRTEQTRLFVDLVDWLHDLKPEEPSK